MMKRVRAVKLRSDVFDIVAWCASKMAVVFERPMISGVEDERRFGPFEVLEAGRGWLVGDGLPIGMASGAHRRSGGRIHRVDVAGVGHDAHRLAVFVAYGGDVPYRSVRIERASEEPCRGLTHEGLPMTPEVERGERKRFREYTDVLWADPDFMPPLRLEYEWGAIIEEVPVAELAAEIETYQNAAVSVVPEWFREELGPPKSARALAEEANERIEARWERELRGSSLEGLSPVPIGRRIVIEEIERVIERERSGR